MMSRVGKMDIVAFLQSQQSKYPEFQEYWISFEESYNKKLWHQLTIKLYQFIKLQDPHPCDLISLYTNFISDFETKMNPLTLVEAIVFVVKQIKDYEECLAFLTKMKEKVKSNQNASLLCSILMGQMKLIKRDMKGVKAIIDEIGPIIDEETSITPIHGRYYLLSSEYHQIAGNHCEYYREALRFLGCSQLEDQTPEELKHRAFTLSLAALLGETVFNFGELLQHPIMNYLAGPNAWLGELLYAFNSGDLQKYEALKPQWINQADLKSQEQKLRQKISLLCLMEMTFKTPNGILLFNDIAQNTHLPLNEVELLVMKALSLGLVKGTIDEVDSKVHLYWVQPRVLDKNQISSMRSKLDSWCRDIKTMEDLMENKAQDIIG